MAGMITVKVELCGGLETLFDNQRTHDISLSDRNAKGKNTTVEDLILELCDKNISDKDINYKNIRDERSKSLLLDDSM